MTRGILLKMISTAENLAQFFEEAVTALGGEAVTQDTEALEDVKKNTLGIERAVVGIVYPNTVLEVEKIVALANEYAVPLYPISRGKNIGYGEKLPAKAGCCVVSLERMQTIRDFDALAGEITVEPGVTQGQLSEFLENNHIGYFADVTGAPRDASIVGNILDGGFGHSPYGEHRRHIADIEVVLGNGTVLTTGDFPSLGPNLAYLFVQSNFGIVTAVRVPLLRIPPHIETFTISFPTQAELMAAVEPLRLLRQQGIIQGSLHIANATRTYMSVYAFPTDVLKSQRLTDDDCIARMKNPFVRIGTWTAIGSLYGNRELTEIYKKQIVAHLPRGAQAKFFTQAKIKTFKAAVKNGLFFSKKYQTLLAKSLESLEHLEGLTRGVPTDAPTENILWRSERFESLGVIWHSPVIRATKEDISKLLSIAEPLFKKYNYEMPLTLTMIDHEHLIGIFNINFDKTDEKAVSTAHTAYQELAEACKAAGISIYRMTVLNQDHYEPPVARFVAITELKRAWDPNNIIAPGRYGIDLDSTQ